MSHTIGTCLQESPVNWTVSRIWDMQKSFESILNTTRAFKSGMEYIIKIKNYDIINPILSKFCAVHINLNAVTLLEPLSRAVGKGRDYLNMFEIVLRTKRICEKKLWVDDPRTKLFATLAQWPQKLLETLFINPSSLGIYDLEKACQSIGMKCAAHFGDSWIWPFIIPKVIFNIKECFALTASSLNAVTYFNDIRRENEKHKLRSAKLIELNNLQDALKELQKDNAQDQNSAQETSKKLITQFNEATQHRQVAAGRLNPKKSFLTLAQLQDKMQNEKNPTKKEWLTLRYMRRYVLEKGLADDIKPELPKDLPKEVGERLYKVYDFFPTAAERLSKVVEYKKANTETRRGIGELERCRSEKSLNFEICKVAIITLGLLASALTTAAMVAFLAPIISATAITGVLAVVNFGSWNNLLFISITGMIRTGYTAIYYEPQLRDLEKKLPRPQDVFSKHA